MDLQAKLATLTAERQEKDAIRARALQAADEASLQIAVLDGAIGIVTELLKEQADGHA